MAIKTIKGKVDYDYKYDILYFKAEGADYNKSLELENLILDIDKKGSITGIQIMDASKFLELNKPNLLKIPKWKFQTSIHDGRLELRLLFQIQIRNKSIEKNPIIMQDISKNIPDSELLCVTA